MPDTGGNGFGLCRQFHHLPEFFRRQGLDALGVLLPEMIAQSAPRNGVAPCPKFLVGVAFEAFETDGNGFQDFLQGVFGGIIGNAAEHKHAQVRFDMAENIFRQP